MSEIWTKVSRVLTHSSNGFYLIKCPGCKQLHMLNVDQSRPQCWQFDGDVEKPTFSPSLMVNGSQPEKRCHSFIRNGQIQFLSDCHHGLAGQTVDLPDVEEF